MIPKVEFRVGDFEEMIRMINRFINPSEKGWDWSRIVLNKYPELDKKLDKIKNTEKRKKISYDFFKKFLHKHKKILDLKAKLFQKEWNKINDKYMKTLPKVLEINWPKKDKKIIAYVGLNPICPRDIQNRTFDIYYNSDLNSMIAISMHEILHFLYFEKWKQIFPETKEREFNRPYLAWHLSEMVPNIVLSNKIIQDIFSHFPTVYKEYLKVEINKKQLLNYLRNFYDGRKDFEDFLRKSWNFVKKHEKEITK